MRVVGVIAEYNPFHNGHKRHLEQTRARTGCEYIVVALNGSFSQRGEPMCLDKWTRARMALECGADLVFELPALFGVRSARDFAAGGVRLLAALGVVDGLSFGCETEDVDGLIRAAEYMAGEPEAYTGLLREGLARGESFARARGAALARAFDAPWLNQPNAALALEYIRENIALGAPLRPVAILRSAAHGETRLRKETSATAVREALVRGGAQAAQTAVPEEVYEALRAAWPGQAPRQQALDDLLLYRVRAMSQAELGALCDMGEGLEGRIAKAAQNARSREELLAQCKCKRYPYARLSRLLACALIGSTAALCKANPSPAYARLLGMRKAAAPLLSQISQKRALPVIDRAKALEKYDMFALERRATDLRALLSADPALRSAGQDYTHKLVVL